MKKASRFSLRKKIVLLIIVMAVILSGTALTISGIVFSRNNDTRYRNKATELAATVQAVADAEKVDELRREVEEVYESTKNKVGSENMGTPEYEEYLARFAHIQEGEAYQFLYKQLRGIQVAAGHYRLLPFRAVYQVEKQDNGGVQCNGLEGRHIFKIEDCGTAGIGDITVPRVAYAFRCEESVVQSGAHIFLIVNTFLDESKVGITFGRCVGDDIICDSVGKAPGDDAGLLPESGKLLGGHPGRKSQDD